LAHRTFAGNQSDSTSLVTMVESLRLAAGYPESAELLPAAQVLVIVDAGVATAANLKLLAQAHFHYLVNDTRRGRKKWQAEFAQEDQFQVLPGGRTSRGEGAAVDLKARCGWCSARAKGGGTKNWPSAARRRLALWPVWKSCTPGSKKGN